MLLLNLGSSDITHVPTLLKEVSLRCWVPGLVLPERASGRFLQPWLSPLGCKALYKCTWKASPLGQPVSIILERGSSSLFLFYFVFKAPLTLSMDHPTGTCGGKPSAQPAEQLYARGLCFSDCAGTDKLFRVLLVSPEFRHLLSPLL